MRENYVEFENEIDLLLSKKSFSKIREIASEAPPADVAEYMSSRPIVTTLLLMKILPKDVAADAFSYLDSDIRENIFKNASDAEIAGIIEELSTDDAADALSELPAGFVKRILRSADAETRGRINTFLNYSDESVGSIMTSEYTSLKSSMTVGESIEYIRSVADEKETVYTCYVLGERRTLIGVIELKDILSCRNDFETVENLMNVNIVSVYTKDDKEEAARLTKKYDINSLPVVDSEGRLVGIVTVDDVVDVIEEEATKDIEQMAAIAHVETPYLKTSVLSLVKARIPWLLILMLAGMFNGVILDNYEAAIAAMPIFVTFMPMLMDTGGNCGSQTTAMVIRAMSIDALRLRDTIKVLWKEVRVALIIGITLGVLNFARIYFFTSDPDRVAIGAILGVSMVFTVFMAKSLGAVLPLLAKKLKLDPAVVASPMITTIVDAVSLTFYFNLAMTVLSHRL